MNDDLQNALAEILNKTAQGVEAGVGFLQRELPDVVQQLLVWHTVKSGIFFAITLAACAIFAKLAKTMWAAAKAYEPTGVFDDGKGFRYAAFAVSSLVAGLFALGAANNLNWLQILIAPKLYLIEYAASLVK